MVSAADAQRLRAAQAGIRTLVDRDLDRMWERIWSQIPAGPTQPYRVRDAFLQQIPTLVDRYGEVAAAAAADWYEAQRELAGVSGAFTADLAGSVYDLDAIDGTVRRSAGALWTPDPMGMLASLKPVLGKYVLSAGRETIIRATGRDPHASGWQRVTRAGACEFCQLLAGRGGVYKRDTVHFAAHGKCNCAAVPSWDKDAPEVDVEAYEASRR